MELDWNLVSRLHVTINAALAVLGSSPRQCQQNEQRAGRLNDRGQDFNRALNGRVQR